MANLKEILGKIILTKPDVLQFAKDRKYEESWIIPLTQAKPSDAEINGYLTKDPFKLLIAEFIWNSQDDDNRFVLTLFFDEKCRLKDKKSFINIILDLFRNYRDFLTFIDAIDSTIIGNDYLLKNSADLANMSVFNHWLSVGPVGLWAKGDLYDREKVEAKIHSRPDIEKTTLNYQGLLFRFNVDGSQDGPSYGIKTPCCSKVGNTWVVDFGKVDYWMKLMLG